MFRKYVLTLLAIAGFGLAVYTVIKGNRRLEPAQPVAMPSNAPYESYVAGAALVEARSENVAIGAVEPGVVTNVAVRPGDAVKKGDALFTVDDRALRADLLVREAALRVKERALERLEALPRVEEIPPAEARVSEAEASLADAVNLLEMMERVEDKRARSEEDLSRRRFAARVAETRLLQAKSQLALLRAGAFGPEVAEARAAVESAQSEVEAARVAIERRTVRAPVDGVALQVKIRAGEYAPAGVVADPLILLGDISRLHVRVDIDENDAWRIAPGAPAVAYVRGNNSLKTDLRFERIEPYVIPKRSLTGASVERVDTRVLQAIYSFERGDLPVYVGQQMDVFIEAQPVGNATQVSPTLPGGLRQ